MKIRNTILSLLLLSGGLVAGFAPTASAEIVNMLPKVDGNVSKAPGVTFNINNPTPDDIKNWMQPGAQGWFNKNGNSQALTGSTLSNNGSTLSMYSGANVQGTVSALALTLANPGNYDHLSFSFTLTAPVAPATMSSILWYQQKNGTIVEVARDLGSYGNQQTKGITLGFSAEQLADFNSNSNGNIYVSLGFTGGTSGTATYNNMTMNVGSTAAVPEASTASLALIGLSLFILRRRRRVES